jgi:hypothetical protein
MKWIYSPLAMMRTAFATGAVFTMCFSPLAEAKKAEKYSKTEKVNMFLKETHLADGKDRTWGDLWAQVRGAYPEKTRRQLDLYIAQHRLEPLPKTTASSFKDANGKEQVRLTMTDKKGQVTTLTLTGDEDKPMKVNNITFDKKDMFSVPAMMKKISADPQTQKLVKDLKPEAPTKGSVLTFKEYTRLSARQKAEYFYRLRRATEAAQMVFKAHYGEQALNEFNSKYEYAFNFLFGEEAYADSVKGTTCIIAGSFSTYAYNKDFKKQSCQDAKAPFTSCPGKDIGCNPMVYGFNESGGSYCVSYSDKNERINATAACNRMSPKDTPKDKKRIVESYMKKVKGQDIALTLNSEGKIPLDQYNKVSGYFEDLQKYIDESMAKCNSVPLVKTKQTLLDQDKGCTALKDRAFDLKNFAVNPQPPVVLPAPPPAPQTVTAGGDCDATYATGASLKDDGKTCECPDGASPQPAPKEPSGKICGAGAGVFAAGALGDGTKEEKDKDDKKGGFGWLWPVAIIGGVALGGWLLYKLLNKDDDKKDNTYINPINTAPDTTTPGVTDPECAPGFVRDTVGGVCHETVIPVIPDPVTPTTPVTPVTPTLPTAGEGTGGTDDILSGGTIQQR